MIAVGQTCKQSLSHRLGRLEKWCTYGNLAEAFLILVNGLLIIKALANLSSILIEDPDGLILEYNGHLLFDGPFRWTTIFINLLVLLTSFASLFVILLTATVRHPATQYCEQYNMKRHKLLRYSTVSQLVLAFIILLLMGKLWFAPPKIELNRSDWDNFVDNYDYSQAHDHFSNNNNNSNHHHHHHQEQQQQYVNPFDRLQQTLGCCGLRTPSEWTSRTSTLTGLGGLLAPSCCSNPSIAPRGELEEPSKGSVQVVMDGRHQIHYCASLDGAIMRIDSNGLEMAAGCQQRLSERESRFLFTLRMRLLLLLAALFLMIQASLTFYLPSIMPSASSAAGASFSCSSSHRQPNYSCDNRTGNSGDNNRHRFPPDYWHAPSGSGVVVLVGKATSNNSNNPVVMESQIDCRPNRAQTLQATGCGQRTDTHAT